MRTFVPLVFIAALAAACGGGSSPHATPTPPSTATRVPVATPAPTTQAAIPFTPVEEVLTPPPDIDTSRWLTYRDDANGFELKYPPDATAKRNVRAPLGVSQFGTLFELSVQAGTTLEKKRFFVAGPASARELCASPSNFGQPGPPVLVEGRNGVMTFMTTAVGGRGGSQEWLGITYFIDHQEHCASLMTDLELGNIGLFPTGTIPADKEVESRVFTAILTTFRWLD